MDDPDRHSGTIEIIMIEELIGSRGEKGKYSQDVHEGDIIVGNCCLSCLPSRHGLRMGCSQSSSQSL